MGVLAPLFLLGLLGLAVPIIKDVAADYVQKKRKEGAAAKAAR